MSVNWTLQDFGDLTPYVVYEGTKLKSAAQGVTTESPVFLRDIGISPLALKTGKRLTVDVDGLKIWTGYLLRASRRYWFDVDTMTTLQRLWVLAVVDINILFAKRIVYRKSAPANINGPVYKTSTYDDTAIANLTSNWLDLSTDDLDVSSLVDRVALITDGGEPTYPWNGGEMWGEAMHTIAQLPAAMWAFNPDRKLVYADVDVEDAPFELADFPGSGQVGYREVLIESDGAQLANDVMGWGFGKGDDQGVFKRLTSAGSVSTHGVWQDSTVRYDVYKQSTIDRIVDSIVNGSPSSRRGRKNDRFAVECSIVENGLRVGQRVRFINHEYGIDDVVPVREMEISFPEGNPYYALKLSHEYDDPWTYADILPFPGIRPIGDFPCFDCPGFETQPGGFVDCVFTTFDDFNRTVASNWQPPPSGHWNQSFPGGGSGIVADVDGSAGRFTFTPTVAGQSANVLESVSTFGTWNHDNWTMRARFYWSSTTDRMTGDSLKFDIIRSGVFRFLLDINPDLDPGEAGVVLGDFNGGFGNVALWPDGDTPGWYRLEVIHRTGAAAIDEVRIWPDSGSRPTNALVANSSPTSANWLASPAVLQVRASFGFNLSPPSGDSAVFKIDYMEFSDACAPCTPGVRFDEFNREETDTWGTSDAGLQWTDPSGPPSFPHGVTGGSAFADISSLSGLLKDVTENGPWSVATGFVMTCKFRITEVPPGGEGPDIVFLVLGSPFPDLFIRMDTGSGQGTVEVSDATSDSVEKLDWTTDWFIAVWERVPGGVSRAKVYREIDGDPGTWLVEATAGAVGTGFEVDLESHSSTVDPQRFEIDYIDFTYEGQCEGSEESVQTSGEFCEEQDIAGGLPTLTGEVQLQHAFWPGSVRVALNGHELIGGLFANNADFEETDDTLGKLTMASPLNPGDHLTICYKIVGYALA